ncbi:phage resistance protein [Blastopirellula marina]|uniref:Phage resistance protein n=1 Tax=Blastopirellula marina TaxID=124 RepID=A0A2S8F9T6_9BACT|nr:phage resistance protein [Blastopirellula marina]PQO28928.1 phage resistance protein [Blastopirellula marina]PTL42201.1 phage resistance protein [Blastopirellula marina]
MTLIKELIDIPEDLQKGDFVLRLAEDIKRPEVVLDNYVVTPELAKCYDSALSFIRSALQNRTSKATFLHGSFGSGKSHFMAVLHLILQGNAAARGIPELASVIQKHNEWLAGKKFLLVPYHMIGAQDMESGVLGNYVEFMRSLHPEAPTPPVYVSTAIIEQVKAERQNYGDELFFKRLNEGQGGGGGWGDLETAWDADSFEAAAAAPPDSEEHLRLVSALLKSVASSHAEVMSHRGGSFVRFDKGLSLISQHAKSQGYDALILFLDELILWLATNSADLGFVKREAAKLTNLVEAQSAERPIPLISFVARQRDLRDLVGDHVPGAEKLGFSDSLDWQQGRFDTITLEDRNLPAIAEKRVLKCRSSAAKGEMDAAFEQTIKMKDNVMDILLTREGDRQMFRQVYPFSPALVQTLIAVSSVLQRERTALKVMLKLLVDHRDTLKLGELIPVGDLFDVVAHGDEAFSQEMAIHFDNAKRLYHQKLLPVLEKQHGMRREDVEELSYDDPKRTAFRNDDRLIKTLLLSALVPEVESLRGLTAEKLAALNHGTIKSPIPGKESAEVLRRCKTWAASVGEIRIGEEANPTITVQLSGVDTESIIEQARREDNQGNRIRRVRQMLFEQVGIQGEGEFEQFHEFWWRNTKRNCKVLFKNIRELPPSSLENDDEDWKLIIDFPFDEPGHGPRDDLSKIQQFLQIQPEGGKTMCWVPSFFSLEAQKDLGMLVILEHILTGERFGQYSSHLSPQDQQAAKSVLDSQRSQLRQRVQNHLDSAYGLESVMQGSLDTTHDLDLAEHYMSLSPGFIPRPPVAPNLAGAMQHLLSQALEHEFPAAPHFETEIKSNSIKKVYEQILPATQTTDGRLAIDKTMRPIVRQIAVPLLLGEMGTDATHFVLGQHWKMHFGRKAAEAGGAISVRKLREWLNDPKPMGLPKEAENLVILMYAAQTSQSFYQHGGPYSDASLNKIPDECELRKENLPEAADWEIALKRAGSIFGEAGLKLLSAGNVSQLSSNCKTKAAAVQKPCQAYAQLLKHRMAKFGISSESTDRMKTANATQVLVGKLCDADSGAIVKTLATATIETSEASMGECVAKAAELEGNLDTAGWQTFELIRKLPEEYQSEAQRILGEVDKALASDEHVISLAPTLKTVHSQAMRLLEKQLAKVQPPEPPVKPLPKSKDKLVEQGSQEGLTLEAAKKLLGDLEQKGAGGKSVRVNLSWVIETGGDA